MSPEPSPFYSLSLQKDSTASSGVGPGVIVFLPVKNKNEKDMRNFTHTKDYFTRTYGTFIRTEMTLFTRNITRTVKMNNLRSDLYSHQRHLYPHHITLSHTVLAPNN